MQGILSKAADLKPSFKDSLIQLTKCEMICIVGSLSEVLNIRVKFRLNAQNIYGSTAVIGMDFYV